jgi:OmpA-OmpF porin, OOP family
MKKTTSVLAIACLAGALAAPAAAQERAKVLDRAVYIGVNGGTAMAKDGCAEGVIRPCDNKDSTWGAFAGFQASRFFAVEIGYRSLGKLSDQNDMAGSTARVRSKLVDGVLVLSLPVERLSIYGKAGMYRAKSDLTSSVFADASNKNTQWTVGAGLRYDVARHLALRLEFQRYNNLGGGDIGLRSDVDVTTLGALLLF